MRRFHSLVTGTTVLLLSACRMDVVVTGDGAGQVTSSDGAIHCSNTQVACTANYPLNKAVTLVAEAAPNARFAGWSGACTGNDSTCTVPITSDSEAFARFETLLPENLACGTAAAKAGCLSPQQSPEYYIEQSIKYFLTMESTVDVRVQPNYSLLVARWEWQPWLMLTGFGNANLILTDVLLKLHPTRYSAMDCQAFPVQPYGRCHVVFDYSGEPCPIYEEFTFNDQGEITFIEAWSDYPTLIPMQNAADYWAEGDDVRRLATRIPGLGTETGLIHVNSPEMAQAAMEDADVADFTRRAQKPYSEYFKQLATHAVEVANGCKPPKIPSVALTQKKAG